MTDRDIETEQQKRAQKERDRRLSRSIQADWRATRHDPTRHLQITSLDGDPTVLEALRQPTREAFADGPPERKFANYLCNVELFELMHRIKMLTQRGR